MLTNHNSILYLSCPQCGLLNIPERHTCKRCQTALDSGTTVRVPAPRSHRASLPRGCMILWLAFMGGIGVLFIYRVMNPLPPTVPTPGSPIFFHGNSIVLLRMVSRPPYEGIDVLRDGRVSRFTYPINGSNPSTDSVVTAPELEAIQKLRQQWCQHIPPFRPLAPTEPFYDLAFECGGYTAKQAKVPIDMLPSVIQALVQRLPHPT